MDDKEAAICLDKAQIVANGLQEILRQRARILSEVPAAEESGEKIAILCFQLGEELYGIELKYLAETRRSVPVRRLPSAPTHLVGIVNLRGELLPVIDLCPILGLPQRELSKIASTLLVLKLKDHKWALAVDSGQEILTFSTKDIMPLPLSLDSEHAAFIRGQLLSGNRPLGLLNMERLQQDPRLAVEETSS
jgi:purine-binding chemotaxis protein CheW